MALSNMWREPRRELTETAIGIAAVGVITYVDFLISAKIHAIDAAFEKGQAMPTLGYMALLPVGLVGAVVVLWLAALGVHAIGEVISDALADKGMDPRPNRRYY